MAINHFHRFVRESRSSATTASGYRVLINDESVTVCWKTIRGTYATRRYPTLLAARRGLETEECG